MLVHCSYSGLALERSPFFPSLVSYSHSHHFIFDLPFQQILELCKTKHTKAIEERLLFISLLKHTNLVEFKFPCNPSPVTITNHFNQLLQFTFFIQNHPKLLELFPRLVITQDNYTIENFPELLDEWTSIKNSKMWTTNRAAREKAQAQAYLEQELDLALVARKEVKGKFERSLIYWAFDKSHLPEIKKARFARIFLATPSQVIKCVRKSSLQEVLDWMMDNLEDDNFGKRKAILNHLQRKLELIDQEHKTFQIIHTIPSSLVSQIEGKIEMKEPTREQFNTNIEFLKAKALYLATKKPIHN